MQSYHASPVYETLYAIERQRVFLTMRKHGKSDSNQPAIVKALRDMGASVLVMSALGNGAPDICVGYRGVNFLFEIKDGEKPPSQRKLTPDEIDFRNAWNGHAQVVNSLEDAISIITARF